MTPFDPFADFQNDRAPLVDEARNLRRATERLFDMARRPLASNQDPSPSGQRFRVYSDVKLTSSGNTTTCASSESARVSLYTPEGWIDKDFLGDVTNDGTGATTNKKYDHFLYFDDVADTWVLDKIAWTNETTRATSLETVDGVRLSSADNTWRYVGTGRYDGSTMLIASSDSLGMTWYGTGDPEDPTGADPFSGVIMDADGIRGYKAGVLQFQDYSTNGTRTAGAGAVVLDIDGVSLLVGDTLTLPSSVSFLATNFSNALASYLSAYVDGFDNILGLRTYPIAGRGSSLQILSEGDSGEAANISLQVAQNVLSAGLSLTIQGSGASAAYATFDEFQFSSSLTLAEISTPATPASGYGKIYPKSDGLWYAKDDSGTEKLFALAGGYVDLTSNQAIAGDKTFSSLDIVGGLTTINLNSGSLPTPTTGTLLQIGQANTTANRIGMDAFAGANTLEFRRADNTNASKSALAAASETIGQIAAFGYGATGYSASSRAALVIRTTQTWDDSKQGTEFLFNITPNDSTTAATVLRLGSGNTALTVGFFGVTPAVRASAYTQTYSTAARTVTSGMTVDQLAQIVNSIIDDMQAYGLAQ